MMLNSKLLSSVNTTCSGWRLSGKELKWTQYQVPRTAKDIVVRPKAIPVSGFERAATLGFGEFRPLGGVGIVEVSSSQHVSEGELVAYSAGQWGERIVLPETAVVRVNKSVPVEYAAVFGSFGAAAARLLAGLNKGDVVALDSPTSTLGLVILQLAKSKGLRVVCVGHQRNSVEETETELLKTLGADFVLPVNIGHQNIGKLIAELPPASRAFTTEGGYTADVLQKLLKDHGDLVILANGSHSNLQFSPAVFIQKQLTCRGFSLAQQPTQNELREAVEQLSALTSKKDLTLYLERFALKEAPLALERVGGRHLGLLMGDGVPATWGEEFSSKVDKQSRLYNSVVNAIVKEVAEKGPRVDASAFPKPSKTGAYEEWLPKDWQKEVLQA